jgi:hypothetical protein
MNARAQKCVVGVLQLPYKIQGWKDAEMQRCCDAAMQRMIGLIVQHKLRDGCHSSEPSHGNVQTLFRVCPEEGCLAELPSDCRIDTGRR